MTDPKVNNSFRLSNAFDQIGKGAEAVKTSVSKGWSHVVNSPPSTKFDTLIKSIASLFRGLANAFHQNAEKSTPTNKPLEIHATTYTSIEADYYLKIIENFEHLAKSTPQPSRDSYAETAPQRSAAAPAQVPDKDEFDDLLDKLSADALSREVDETVDFAANNPQRGDQKQGSVQPANDEDLPSSSSSKQMPNPHEPSQGPGGRP